MIYCDCMLINFDHALIFSVKTSRHHRDGVDRIYTYALECAPLQKSKCFDLTKDDPKIYSEEDLVGYNPEREWKNIPLPQPSAAAAQSVQQVSIPDEVIKKAQNQHDALCKWMKTAGIDLCKDMEDTENQFVLEAVQAKEKDCPICQKKCHNTQRLRAHIRTQHMNQTPFHCADCDKYFGDNNTLKLHNRKHDPDATVFACDEEDCDKVFREKGRLTQHKKLHIHS